MHQLPTTVSHWHPNQRGNLLLKGPATDTWLRLTQFEVQSAVLTSGWIQRGP